MIAVWCTKHRNVEAAVKESLELLGLDYLDLCEFCAARFAFVLADLQRRFPLADLIHWPVPLNGQGNDPKFPKLPDGSRDRDTEWSINQTWEQMEAILEKGLVKAIGVSK